MERELMEYVNSDQFKQMFKIMRAETYDGLDLLQKTELYMLRNLAKIRDNLPKPAKRFSIAENTLISRIFL